MAIPVRIESSGKEVAVSPVGQLITAPFAYNDVKVQTLDADNVPENFWTPCPGFKVVITGMIVSGDRTISANDAALLEIFTADSITSGTALSPILSLEVAKNTIVPLFGLNLLVPEGLYVNAKADDSNVLISIFGYYVPNTAV